MSQPGDGESGEWDGRGSSYIVYNIVGCIITCCCCVVVVLLCRSRCVRRSAKKFISPSVVREGRRGS